MNSTLKLYAVDFNPDDSAVVDDLQDYLTDLQSKGLCETVEDFQYIRHALNISIKVDES